MGVSPLDRSLAIWETGRVESAEPMAAFKKPIENPVMMVV
jgi:hypothetical protein